MRVIKTIFTLLFLTVIVLGAVFFVGFVNFKKEAVYSINKVVNNAELAADALKNLETKQAKYSLQIIKDEIGLWLSRFNLLSGIFPPLREIPAAIEKYNNLAASSVIIAEKLDFLKNRGMQLVLQQKGQQLITVLKELQAEIDKVLEVASDEKLHAAKTFLSALVNWLDSDEPQHFLILFQNSSEIRPGGGFLGSFAQLTLKRGGLNHLEVNDIYDLDGQLTLKVEPPKALQSITTNWGARDANWFLDFPTSARKVIKFLEASRIFQDRGIRFSGIIAINDKVINEIIDIIGPIELNDPPLTLTAENFLPEIQKEVETKANKNILKQITPIIFERLNKLTGDSQKKELLNIFGKRFENKDIMVYFENPIMESFTKSLSVGGEWFELDSNFSGDYLAVVNANVAGGKTDAFIKQKISLYSEIGRDGIINNTLSIQRENLGNQREEKWYNTANQNFIQIFTPKDTESVSLTGNDQKEIRPTIDYRKAGYDIDPDLEARDDKNIVSAWFNVPAGETKTLILSYRSLTSIDFDKELIPYNFVYDKQSGVDGELEIILKAPMGFVWKENAGEIFKYYSNQIPARVILNLNLIKKGTKE